MPVKEDRQYRNAQMQVRMDEEKKSYIVEGYATTWERYKLYDRGEESVYEQFSKEDFAGTDMGDVIMQYDHNGPVYARMSNDSLHLSFDEYGLKVVADLGRTEKGKSLYEDIATGMVTKMSWGFIPNELPEYDPETRTITWHKGIRKIYDVSAVSIPANDTTEISARNACEGVIESKIAECIRLKELETKRQELLAKLEREGF